MLWSHLLQTTQNHPSTSNFRQASSSGTGTVSTKNTVSLNKHAPIVATDRTGTSARILLHDTKASLEKFTDSVHNLVKDVDASKNKMDSITKLFGRGQENIIEEMVSVVNRCQVELQRSLGAPAQQDKLEHLNKDVTVMSRRLESLSKEVEILHMVNQTQSRTLASIQEQQSQLISSITPLLPLVQAIPLHIESSRTYFKEHLDDAMGDMMPRLVQKCLNEALRTVKPRFTKMRTEGGVDSHTASKHMSGYMRSPTSLRPLDSSPAVPMDPLPSSSLALLSSPTYLSAGSTSERPLKRRKLDSFGDDDNDDPKPISPSPSSSSSSVASSTVEGSQEIPLLTAPQISNITDLTGDLESQQPSLPSQYEPLEYPPPNQLARISRPIDDIPAPHATETQTSLQMAVSPVPHTTLAESVSTLAENALPVTAVSTTSNPTDKPHTHQNLDSIYDNRQAESNRTASLPDVVVLSSIPSKTPSLVAYSSSPVTSMKPMSIKQRRAYGIASVETRREKRFIPVTDDEDEDDGWDGFGF
ncbi:hypothetical protein QCA50_013662 [Cerrena zonata]|uniref:BLOC-1-related complex subunit 5 n=1 Tax=Cerrena zonata TaxID=2478898 RepID=A0AAW0FQ46_9APHY